MGRPRKIKQNYITDRNYLLDFLVTVILLCVLFLIINILTPVKGGNVFLYSRKILTNGHSNNPRSFSTPILLYHYVEDVKDTRDTIRRSLNINPYVFENQITTLTLDGYTFLTPKDINEILDNRRGLPKNPIILSFDDGYEDFYTDVFPVLKKHRVRAIAYIVSGFLDKPNYMTGSQVAEVINSGLVEIGCHTAHHPNLKHASPETAKKEIVGCENDIASQFGIKPVSFAYPYGAYNSDLFNILKEAGLRNAVTTKAGVNVSANNIYEIPRIRPGARMGQELTSYLKNETLTAGRLPF